jgi:hypothetical protein
MPVENNMIHAQLQTSDVSNAAAYLAQHAARVSAIASPSPKALAIREYFQALYSKDVAALAQALADLRAAGVDASKLPK